MARTRSPGGSDGLPDRFPMRVTAKDQETGRARTINVQIADETGVGVPTGASALSFVGTGAVATAAASILEGGTPARQSGDMCATFTIREAPKPVRFCNRYVLSGLSLGGEAGFGVASAMVSDFGSAVAQIDEFKFGVLHVTNVEVNLTVRRGVRQAFLIKATGPKTVRRGTTARLKVTTHEVRGRVSSRTVNVKVPAGIPAGRRLLTLDGTPSDESGVLEIDLGELLFGGGDEGDAAGPRTVDKVVKAIRSITRYDGVRVSFQRPGGGDEEPQGAEARARKRRPAFRDPDVRLSGRVRVTVQVR
jgi:hypothetical protein